MPRLSLLLPALIAVALAVPAFAQAPGPAAPALRCDAPSPTPGHRARLRAAADAPARRGGIVQIPVVFHVVTVGAAASQGNVPPAWIEAQLNVLNTVFFPLGYRLILVDQQRVRNPEWWGIARGSPEEAEMKAALARDPASFLNLYSTRIAADGLGWAYLPGTFDPDPAVDEQDDRHGLVLSHDTLPGGGRSGYDRGDTAVHEMGHFMGLLHTFEGWTPQAPTAGCDVGDDVADTPFEASPNFFGCDLARDTCPALPGADPVANYMDFSPDACLDRFSTGQENRMASLFETFKPTLAAGPEPFVVEDSLAFGSVVVGRSARASVRIANLGGPPFTVAQIQSSDAAFAPVQQQVFVQVGTTVEVEVDFEPPAAGPFAGTLTLVTDDASVGTMTVPVAGAGRLAPALDATPLALTAALPLGGATALDLVLANGGDGPLEYEVVGQGVAAGGPDAFGYTWQDSDTPGGPAFEAVTLSVLDGATPLVLDDDDAERVQLPFAMPFYGDAVDDVFVASNGYLSFYQASTTFENVAIPTPGDPDGIVAPYWDDLTFTPDSRVLTRTLPDGRFAVQWTDMAAFETTGLATFQAILAPSGDIVFQYLANSFGDDSATIGIENADGTVGLQVARDAEYARAGLAVRFSTESTWLAGITPSAGTVAPGDAAELSVALDAAGLEPAAYQDLVDVVTNDPDRPLVRVHTVLAVAGAFPPPALVAPLYGDAAVAMDAPLAWLPVEGASGYRIQVATDVGFQDVVEERVVNATTAQVELEFGQAYAWRVRSLGAEPSGWSIPFRFTTAPFVASEPAAPAGGLTLGDPFPNPARSALSVPFALARPGAVRAEVFSATGRRVAVLADGAFPAGSHRLRWAVGGVPAGVYLVRVTRAGDVASRRVVVLP